MIAPCSMKTLSAIVNSYADSLIARAADVVLKERRRLVLMPRESPLHTGHCKLLYEASQLGAVIAPPMPAFYSLPQTLDDLVNHSVGRVLDLFDLDAGILKRWEGPPDRIKKTPEESDRNTERKTRRRRSRQSNPSLIHDLTAKHRKLLTLTKGENSHGNQNRLRQHSAQLSRIPGSDGERGRVPRHR